LTGDGGEEVEELARLNREYEERFPGLRYVLWVNGRPRGEVLRDMRERIERGDVRAEERAVIEVSLFFSVLFRLLLQEIFQFQYLWGTEN
jgi:2-oxo-4-hydroxy-4-carboxy--5-ureidoimidazoline (OHCU) decarboxylase